MRSKYNCNAHSSHCSPQYIIHYTQTHTDWSTEKRLNIDVNQSLKITESRLPRHTIWAIKTKFLHIYLLFFFSPLPRTLDWCAGNENGQSKTRFWRQGRLGIEKVWEFARNFGRERGSHFRKLKATNNTMNCAAWKRWISNRVHYAIWRRHVPF